MLIDGSPVRTQEHAAGLKNDLDAPASVVSEYIAPPPGRHLPHMLLATTLVAVLPLALSLALRASGLVSGWVSVGVAVAMSLACSTAGNAYWRKRGGHGEVLFGELLLWGWIRSWRQERELANATRLLGLVNTGATQRVDPEGLDVEQREHLLQQLAGALEGQDIYLNGHSRRVARHATMIARGMGLSSEEVARVRAAAAVHDVGKLRTPKAILNKPGRLTDAEFEVIKRHPVDGAEMVAALGDPELTRIVRHHHERLDGAGYPGGLHGDEIPVGARIIAVADTFDAITSARPYRDAAPHQKAIDILRKEAGTQLDPDAVRAFLAYYSGRRPMVVWAIITSSLRRLVAWLSGDPAAAATISGGKLAAATAATAAIGAVAGAAPVPVVHHTPSRPAIAHHHVHAVTPRTRGAAIGLRRQTVSVRVPAASPATAHRSTKAATARRRGAHSALAHRPHANRTAGSSSSRGSLAPTAAGPSIKASPATPTSSGAHGQSAGGSSVSGARATTPRASGRAPTSQSHGSDAKGNAYGHRKPLGNGHGNGLAQGHGTSEASPPSPHAPSTPAAASTTRSTAGGQNAASSHALGASSLQSSAGQGSAHAIATPAQGAAAKPSGR